MKRVKRESKVSTKYQSLFYLVVLEMYLAAKRAEAEAIINEATIANLAGIGHSFPRPRLRPLIQEDDFSTIDHIGLDPTYIKILLYLIHPYNIMIRRSPYLNGAMILVMSKTKRAKWAIGAV